MEASESRKDAVGEWLLRRRNVSGGVFPGVRGVKRAREEELLIDMMARVAKAYLAGELPVGALGVVQKQEPSTVAERMRLMEPWELAEFTHSAVLTATRIARDAGTGEDRAILAQERALPLDDVAARIALVERCRTVIDG